MREMALPTLRAVTPIGGCKAGDTVVNGVKSAGSAMAGGLGSVETSLVKVYLSNMLNDLAPDLKIDKSIIPTNAQITISLAANVCGISINILSISGGGSSRGAPRKWPYPNWCRQCNNRRAEPSADSDADSNP